MRYGINQHIRADRWIGYPRAVEGLNRLEALFAWPNKQRMPNLLLVGPTNNGKSMIIEKFRSYILRFGLLLDLCDPVEYLIAACVLLSRIGQCY